tara:strand:+ start:104 stop:325 length:222 start_codon:yes stop_codon:yes gene_type:complete
MFTENSDSFEEELIEIETNFENTLLEINNDDNNHDNNENGYSQEVIIDDSPNKEKVNETEKKYSPSKKINMLI